MPRKIIYWVFSALVVVACTKQVPDSSDVVSARQQPKPVKIGELLSYAASPTWAHLTKKGWQLAVEQFNAAGGVLGQPVEVISRDAKGGSGKAATVMLDLIEREQVDFVVGGMFSHVALEISQVAERENILLMVIWAGSSKLLWENGHDHVFRIQPPSYFYGRMFAEAARELPAKRWVTIAPNFEAGHAFTADFKSALTEMRPDVEWVGEYWPTLGKIDAGPTVQAIKNDKPDAIFGCLAGPDLNAFIREGRLRGLFDDIDVVDCFAGLPENWSSLGEELPSGWITVGFPIEGDISPELKNFSDQFQTRWNERPGLGSWFGYLAMNSLLQAIETAGSKDREAVRAVLRSQSFRTPIGNMGFRSIDQQSSVGLWLGRTATTNGQPAFVDAEYKSGDQYYPSDEHIQKLRNVEGE
ncbi:MAG: ABC transporter substrate-binding protein [Gammaproteobacteria bacterium]|nr:ABC transporter substrate-binding protein [Gammaproteobacteria bacterium]